jgi:hypothetical protein
MGITPRIRVRFVQTSSARIQHSVLQCGRRWLRRTVPMFPSDALEESTPFGFRGPARVSTLLLPDCECWHSPWRALSRHAKSVR